MDTASALRLLEPQVYLSSFLAQNVRPDGRSPLQRRRFAVRAAPTGGFVGVLGATKVLVRVLSLVGPPVDSEDAQADLQANVWLWGGASGRAVQQRELQLSHLLKQWLQGVVPEAPQLLIQKDVAAWHLRVEGVVLSDAGNVAEALGSAAFHALQACRLPPVEMVDGIAYEVDGEGVALELDGTVHVCGVGVFKDQLLRDPVSSEMDFLDCVVWVVHDGQRHVCAVHKEGAKAISTDTLDRCIDMALDEVPQAAATVPQAAATVPQAAATDT
eukprot:scaffold2945_cov244-Pinguiococcus_pyrenoidosus.AAC.6